MSFRDTARQVTTRAALSPHKFEPNHQGMANES